MRETKISSLIRKSIDRSELILFRPFELKKWLALILIAALAGALGGGNGANPRSPNPQKREETSIENSVSTESENTAPAPAQISEEITNGSTTAGTVPKNNIEPAADTLGETAPQEPSSAPNPILIVILVVIGLALSILFTWLSSRFRFIWLNSILQNTSAIREPFGRFRSEGNNLFKALLAILGGTLLYAAIVFGLMFLVGQIFGVFKEGFAWDFSMGLVFTLISILFLGIPGILLALAFLGIEDFVITIMTLEPSKFRDAWKSFWGLYSQNKKDFWIYVFVKIGLSIVAMLLQLMLLIGWALLALVTGAIIFGIPYYIFSVLLKINMIFWILAGIAGIPFLIVFILLMAAINLPFATFFRSFSLYFLSSLKTKYTPLPLE